ncbi:hypothetical protein [Rhodococcus sp. ARC_M6]|uniref:hypothetical protein n=1 Tax=Rhodococcus sp. ARC_M6 TaxID=2928852 RepID=UPI001FB52422|nr:hypothetical protein [Rhodococcus sp. ARC_M6]MCJ0903543.1 hypothetical protein [Rhodococcus sp. ARC_M6]
MPNTASPETLPNTVKWAGALVTLQGLVAVGFAVVAVIRGLMGHDQSVTNGYGFAAWVAILGGAVLAAGIALLAGRRWGRSISVVAQLLLLPVAWSLLTDSHQVFLGVVLGTVVLATLVFLFSAPTSQWMAAEYGDFADETATETVDDAAERENKTED